MGLLRNLWNYFFSEPTYEPWMANDIIDPMPILSSIKNKDKTFYHNYKFSKNLHDVLPILIVDTIYLTPFGVEAPLRLCIVEDEDSINIEHYITYAKGVEHPDYPALEVMLLGLSVRYDDVEYSDYKSIPSSKLFSAIVSNSVTKEKYQLKNCVIAEIPMDDDSEIRTFAFFYNGLSIPEE